MVRVVDELVLEKRGQGGHGSHTTLNRQQDDLTYIHSYAQTLSLSLSPFPLHLPQQPHSPQRLGACSR